MQGFSQQSLHLTTRFSNGMTSVKNDKGDGRDAESGHRRKLVYAYICRVVERTTKTAVVVRANRDGEQRLVQFA
jgi:hypothetical protein